MGSLRRWKQKHTYKNNLDVAVRAGIKAWVVEPRPFFVKDEHRGMFSVLAPADDGFDDDWGDRLATAIEGGDVQVEWIVPAEAAAIRWSDFAGEHTSDLQTAFSKRWTRSVVALPSPSEQPTSRPVSDFSGGFRFGFGVDVGTGSTASARAFGIRLFHGNPCHDLFLSIWHRWHRQIQKITIVISP